MKWRVWFEPKHAAVLIFQRTYPPAEALAFAQHNCSEVIEAERVFVDPYSKVLAFLPKSIDPDPPAETSGPRRKSRGRPRKAPVHALRGIHPDVWKEFEQEPD